MSEKLLGFQLRQSILELRPWTQEDRGRFLLREDVASPLSVDISVWPLSVNENTFKRVFIGFKPGEISNGLRTYTAIDPDYVSGSKFIQESPDSATNTLIAITLLDDVEQMIRENWIEEISTSVEDLIRDGWQRLGYDIADKGMLSGLMNCAYTAEEKSELVAKYAQALNDYGLFSNSEIALEFREESNTRVIDHSPFLRYSVWHRVAATTSSEPVERPEDTDLRSLLGPIETPE